MQIVLNLISVLAFGMSAATWIFTIIKNRKNLSMEIIDYRKYTKSAHFYVCVTNKSQSPISITSIKIPNISSCVLEPRVVREFIDSKTKTITDKIKTPAFPINLQGKEGLNCYLEFLAFQETSLFQGKIIDFEIYTNRGLIKKSIVLGSTERYLHSK